MRIRNAMAAAAFAVSGGVTMLALAVPAQAQAEPCPPGQPSDRPPGNLRSGPPGQPADRPIQYPPGKCQLRLSRSVVAPGGSTRAAGAGFAPGSSVQVAMGSATIGSAIADGVGAFEAPVVVPASTEPGTRTVTASGPAAGGGTQVLSASLTVTGQAAGATAQTGTGAGGGADLPATGSSSPVPLALAGGTLLAVGVGAVTAARRRKSDG